MAIRDHVQMDVLIAKAAALQRLDAELAQLELLRDGSGSIGGQLPQLRRHLRARGSVLLTVRHFTRPGLMRKLFEGQPIRLSLVIVTIDVGFRDRGDSDRRGRANPGPAGGAGGAARATGGADGRGGRGGAVAPADTAPVRRAARLRAGQVRAAAWAVLARAAAQARLIPAVIRAAGRSASVGGGRRRRRRYDRWR